MLCAWLLGNRSIKSQIRGIILVTLRYVTTRYVRCTDADRDSGQQSLWYIGDDDSNQEDDSVEPLVAEDEGDDEERDAEKYRDTGNEVDEVGDLARYRCLTHL